MLIGAVDLYCSAPLPDTFTLAGRSQGQDSIFSHGFQLNKMKFSKVTSSSRGGRDTAFEHTFTAVSLTVPKNKQKNKPQKH